MRIEFLKMQGLGNDFAVFDSPRPGTGGTLAGETIRALADRHTGIGFDQALVLEPARDARHRIFYRVFNSDGGEVEQCGNGARCIAALMYARNPEYGRELSLESAGGVINARIGTDGAVSVNMGVPNFEPGSLPMDAARVEAVYSLDVDGTAYPVGAVSMGNPHVVLLVEDAPSAPVERLGPRIESHPRFAKRTNVGFMQIIDRDRIRLRVYERGVGETRACGTGACAAVAVGRRRELLDREVRVELPGGTAIVGWEGEGQPVWLTGPATTVFSGSIEL